MKLTDTLLNKIGIDKLLHHTVGALICFIIFLISILKDNIIELKYFLYPIIGFLVVFILSVLKEYIFDNKVDWKDIIWSIVGCLWVYIALILSSIFNLIL